MKRFSAARLPVEIDLLEAVLVGTIWRLCQTCDENEAETLAEIELLIGKYRRYQKENSR